MDLIHSRIAGSDIAVIRKVKNQMGIFQESVKKTGAISGRGQFYSDFCGSLFCDEKGQQTTAVEGLSRAIFP